MLVGADRAYTLWAPEYDRHPNPVLALEMRILRDRLGSLSGRTVLDAGCGTGRWMNYAHGCGSRVFGLDRSAAMLARAPGNRVRGDIARLPFADGTVDLVICSMTLGYLQSAADTLHELLRVAKRVVVSDFHPAAVAAGWTRSFRVAGRRFEIEHYCHSMRHLELFQTTLEWQVESCFGEPERSLFEAAGKGDSFEAACSVPVIQAASWSRVSA